MILDFDLCERAMIHGRETNCWEAFIRTTIVALIFLPHSYLLFCYSVLFCTVFWWRWWQYQWGECHEKQQAKSAISYSVCVSYHDKNQLWDEGRKTGGNLAIVDNLTERRFCGCGHCLLFIFYSTHGVERKDTVVGSRCWCSGAYKDGAGIAGLARLHIVPYTQLLLPCMRLDTNTRTLPIQIPYPHRSRCSAPGRPVSVPDCSPRHGRRQCG